ncbi:MAG: hypothetical protein BWY23_02789 [Spirochaetes bacterium ADurb.Bin218]|nr:MAG: hypothetical protein BWY23_02789 [Spirochaetes bacterium ADurb.Bin218]
MLRGENVENNKAESKIRTVNFYLENRKWLEEVVKFGDDYSQALAIQLIKTAKEILNQN